MKALALRSFRLILNFPVSVPDPQSRIAYLERELQWAQLKIQMLEERLRQQRIRILGPHSETLSEVEAEARREPLMRAPRRKRRRHPGRERLPENLPPCGKSDSL